MGMWLYQLSQKRWSPERYRLEIWEHEKWNWPVGDKPPPREAPEPGDTIVFFYAPTGGKEPGFYGWAVVLEWYPDSDSPLYFRAVAPSDYLNMRPWWNHAASDLADAIRGTMKQGTLWRIPQPLAERLSRLRRNPGCGWVAWARATLPRQAALGPWETPTRRGGAICHSPYLAEPWVLFPQPVRTGIAEWMVPTAV